MIVIESVSPLETFVSKTNPPPDVRLPDIVKTSSATLSERSIVPPDNRTSSKFNVLEELIDIDVPVPNSNTSQL